MSQNRKGCIAVICLLGGIVILGVVTYWRESRRPDIEPMSQEPASPIGSTSMKGRTVARKEVTVKPGGSWHCEFEYSSDHPSGLSAEAWFNVACLEGVVEMTMNDAHKDLKAGEEYTVRDKIDPAITKCLVYNRSSSQPARVRIHVTQVD